MSVPPFILWHAMLAATAVVCSLTAYRCCRLSAPNYVRTRHSDCLGHHCLQVDYTPPPAPLPSCLPPPTTTTCMHSMHSGATGGLNMPLSFHSTVWAPVLLLVFQPTRAFPSAITSTLGPPPPRRAPALTRAEKWCVQTPCSLWFSPLQLGRRDP
jgi:hypothetical protein